MATRGAKPKPTALRLVTGNPGKRPFNPLEPTPKGRPTPPVPMRGRPLALWRRYVSRAWWLTETDSHACWLWCQLAAEAEVDVAAMTAARIGQLRACASEIGFNPASRTRLAGPPPSSGNSDYF